MKYLLLLDKGKLTEELEVAMHNVYCHFGFLLAFFLCLNECQQGSTLIGHLFI